MVTNYVLTHGAWHGGWCWRDIAAKLRVGGHDVFTPTLTGLGERAHLLSPSVGLSLHVRDVAAVIEAERLTDVVLVGHSYAGMVLPGVAARVPGRVRRLVIVDGFLPDARDSALTMLPERVADRYRRLAAEEGMGWLLPPERPDLLGVTNAELIEVLGSRLTPHPFSTYEEPSAVGLASIGLPGTFLLCSGWRTPFRPSASRADDLGWTVREFAADHEVLLSTPSLLADELLEAAGKDR